MNTVDKVINIAMSEIGYLEKRSNSQLDDKTANAGSANYTKYGRDMHSIYPQVMDFPAAWCDCFVDWCFMKAYGVSTAKSLLCGNFNDYTVASAQMFKNKKSYYKSNPVVGDQIFFKNAKGGICHTGLVYMVDSTYVYTIEGNTSGASGVIANGGGVCKKKYTLKYNRIDGYGRPRYDVLTTNTINNDIYIVVAGDTLSGIGQKVGMNWRTIADINGIKSPYNISVGQKLKVCKTNTENKINQSKAKQNNVVNNTNNIIQLGQQHANNFAQCGIVADGIRGTNTKKAAIKVIQRALNADYKSNIAEDGIWGNATERAFGNHYVKVGETQYLVTALEILCMLKGKNPNGVECPGKFGNGLASACGTTKAVKSTFKNLCS